MPCLLQLSIPSFHWHPSSLLPECASIKHCKKAILLWLDTARKQFWCNQILMWLLLPKSSQHAEDRNNLQSSASCAPLKDFTPCLSVDHTTTFPKASATTVGKSHCDVFPQSKEIFLPMWAGRLHVRPAHSRASTCCPVKHHSILCAIFPTGHPLSYILFAQVRMCRKEGGGGVLLCLA